MTDDSLRLLNVDSEGVPIGSFNEDIGACLFEFTPNVVPFGPPGSKPADFDPPIHFTDTYSPGQQSPIGTVECRIVANAWEYDPADEYSTYRVSTLVGDVDLLDPGSLMSSDEGPLTIIDVIT